jgi:hypothetical protein
LKDYGDIIERVEALRSMSNMDDRSRVRAVLNGGALGVKAVMSWGYAPKHGRGSGTGADSDLGVDLPTANVMYSGLERLAQRIGRPPTLKTDMLPTRDNAPARKRAEKRERIVRGWDDMTRMELQYPQIGRWLPGYGFTLHVIREREFGGVPYPVAELRDPYDVYPGMWGVDQQPADVAIVRHMSRKQLRRAYPEHEDTFKARWDRKRTGQGIPILSKEGTGHWEGNPNNPVEVIEYICHCGTHVLVPECDVMVGFIPNPLEAPAFVMTKRFSFDKLQSHFAHTFGLMAMMGKLNILGLIATEDGVFRETNIIGEMVGNTYERGRFAVNQFESGTQIEKPTGDQMQQVWQAINILERQFRVVSNYDVSQDGQSPNSFATGQGIRELGASADENVREYQTAIRHSIELIDRKRLEWDEKMHASQSKRVYWYEGGTAFEEKYVPAKDIAGDYRTRRVYGAMATFAENDKIIAGLQLLQAKAIDRRTFQENLDGLDNISLVNERIDQDMAKEMMIGALGSRAGTGQDPRADMALVGIMEKPSEVTSILVKLFTPEEPQMSPEEQMMAQGQGPQMGGMGPEGGMVGEGGPPPAVQTILSQMEGQGGAGGVMSVGQMR